jgi:hypothetical protein
MCPIRHGRCSTTVCAQLEATGHLQTRRWTAILTFTCILLLRQNYVLIHRNYMFARAIDRQDLARNFRDAPEFGWTYFFCYLCSGTELTFFNLRPVAVQFICDTHIDK